MNAKNTTKVSIPRKSVSAVRTGVRAGGCTCIHCRSTVPK